MKTRDNGSLPELLEEYARQIEVMSYKANFRTKLPELAAATDQVKDALRRLPADLRKAAIAHTMLVLSCGIDERPLENGHDHHDLQLAPLRRSPLRALSVQSQRDHDVWIASVAFRIASLPPSCLNTA